MRKRNVGIVVLMMISLAVSAAPAADLVAHFPLDEGSGDTINDVSANALVGTLSAEDVRWVEGIAGSALEFNPLSTDTDGYAEVPAAGTFNGVSLTCWVKNYGQTHWGRLVQFRSTSYCIELGTNDAVWIWFSGTGDLGGALTVPQDGQWHFVGVTVADTECNIYIDDQSETLTYSGDLTFTIEMLQFGNLHIGDRVDRPLHGCIDDWRIYNAILTPAEVEAIKQEGLQGSSKPSNPNPENNMPGVDAALTEVSWDLPESRQTGDVVSAEVFFDPCELYVINNNASSRILAKTPGATKATIPALTLNETYYWKVIVYDPNTPGPEIRTEGSVWNFSTAPVQAWNPSPGDDGTGVSIFPELSWSPGQGATSHTLYGPSTDEAAVANGTASSVVVSALTYDPPGSLQLATEYFWRVDENNGSGDGPVWSFTTTDTEMIADFGWVPGEEAEMRAVWIGDPNIDVIVPSNTGSGWALMPYVSWTQTYTKTFDEDLDLSVGSRLTLWYASDFADPCVTVKLLDAGDQLVLSLDLRVEDGDTFLETNLLAGNLDLTAVRKIHVVVPGRAEGGSFWINDIAISIPSCPNRPVSDLNGDCIGDMNDFAVFASEWLGCGLFPPEACP